MSSVIQFFYKKFRSQTLPFSVRKQTGTPFLTRISPQELFYPKIPIFAICCRFL